MSRLRGYADWVWARLLDPEKVTKGGVVIPDTALESHRMMSGRMLRVVAVGPGEWRSAGPRLFDAARAMLDAYNVSSAPRGHCDREADALAYALDECGEPVRNAPEVKPGDTILIAKKFAGQTIVADLGEGPEELVVVQERHIDAIVEM